MQRDYLSLSHFTAYHTKLPHFLCTMTEKRTIHSNAAATAASRYSVKAYTKTMDQLRQLAIPSKTGGVRFTAETCTLFVWIDEHHELNKFDPRILRLQALGLKAKWRGTQCVHVDIPPMTSMHTIPSKNDMNGYQFEHCETHQCYFQLWVDTRRQTLSFTTELSVLQRKTDADKLDQTDGNALETKNLSKEGDSIEARSDKVLEMTRKEYEQQARAMFNALTVEGVRPTRIPTQEEMANTQRIMAEAEAHAT